MAPRSRAAARAHAHTREVSIRGRALDRRRWDSALTSAGSLVAAGPRPRLPLHGDVSGGEYPFPPFLPAGSYVIYPLSITRCGIEQGVERPLFLRRGRPASRLAVRASLRRGSSAPSRVDRCAHRAADNAVVTTASVHSMEERRTLQRGRIIRLRVARGRSARRQQSRARRCSGR